MVLEAYLAPTCEWSERTAYDLLKYVNADQLSAAPLTFERRRIADKVLQEDGLEVATSPRPVSRRRHQRRGTIH